MARLLIIGASRGIGLETVKTGLAAGHHVRAFARTAESIDIDHPDIERVSGNALSGDDLAPALRDIDCVIHTIGVSSPRDLIFGTTLFSQSLNVLIETMDRVGPKRLILVTGAGAGNSRGRINPLYDHLLFPILLQRVYADKDIAEAKVMASDLDWTIVRPGGLTNAAHTGRYKVLPDMADWRAGMISRANVADFLIREAETGSMRRRTPLLVD